jgi:type IV pilus assembly protein PilP
MKRSGLISSRSTICLAFAGLLLLGGCNQDPFADLREFMAQAGTTGQPPLESLPAVKPQEIFSYEPGEMPDPFKPRNLKPAKGGGALEPDQSRPKEALELFPLDGLRMVGTLIKGGQIYALVRTPENTLYRIKKGEHMGQNFGLVIGITDTSIELRETVQDGVGDWTESKATLALQEQK